jgi:formate hydrogenlyase subunit 3/multisubunit Na+/H+ antiporter MnhD subunit
MNLNTLPPAIDISSLNLKIKNWSVTIVVFALALLSSIPAFQILLSGGKTEYILAGSSVTGKIPIRIDALSSWFILIVNFTFITGILYGVQYLKQYKDKNYNISLHFISYILLQIALTTIIIVQNSFVFLIAWEIMTISAFLLVIFEHSKHSVLKSGLNYLIQSHISVLFLIVGFIGSVIKTNSFDFEALKIYTATSPEIVGIGFFLVFFLGFAVKAGFVPFHTWLPYAHPAAPSHVSGVMSGVIIKIGIYGILRMILTIKTDYYYIGIVILTISVISGIYGVMLAIVQHNLKKLLAYHSIENIGIIGIGIGLGCLGISMNNFGLTFAGFAGALLHTLNHSLFKSLLFFGAGNIYQSSHNLDLEKSGGLIRYMPQTAFLFLLASLAICGIPPFNGFVSEFIIYSGMFHGIQSLSLSLVLIFVFSIFALAFIGGLALLCFTKAFGTFFLGTCRENNSKIPTESSFKKLIPMYLAAIPILLIGIFPNYFFILMENTLTLYTDFVTPENSDFVNSTLSSISTVGYYSMIFIGIGISIFLIRKKFLQKKFINYNSTWGCGYTGSAQKMQYTASSFVRTYRKLMNPILEIQKKREDVIGIFPENGKHEIYAYDKIEKNLIDRPLARLKSFFSIFSFLEKGTIQTYIMYGIAFIALAMTIPFLYEKISLLITFLEKI